jgi:hypothetical protein
VLIDARISVWGHVCEHKQLIVIVIVIVIIIIIMIIIMITAVTITYGSSGMSQRIGRRTCG